MNEIYNKALVPNSRQLRNKMTDEERKLWYCFFKKLDITVRRQKIIGKYIVDFYVPSAKTAVEIDGSQHYKPENKAEDIKRDKYLNDLGIKVLRYGNKDVREKFEAVCENIWNNIYGDKSR